MKYSIRILVPAIFAAVSLVAVAQEGHAPNPIEAELFPPDFLIAQREALGLNETQLQDLQAIVQDVQPKFESLKTQLEDRGKALKEALHQPHPDSAQAEDKMRALLAQETEMKLLQLRLMLGLRSKLTPEQVDKARQLRPQYSGADHNPLEGLQQRLQAKFEKLKAAVEARAAGGQPPEELINKAHEIQQLVQNNKPLEAERQLDALLSTLPEAKPKP
jgi:Spy/CpxP family protein refolding chaperone